MDRRCDMIRGDKIRSKANKKYNSPLRIRSDRSKHFKLSRHRRTISDISDISDMKSVSMADLTYKYSYTYFKKKNINDAYQRNIDYQNMKKNRKKHKRNKSQPARPIDQDGNVIFLIFFIFIYNIYPDT